MEPKRLSAKKRSLWFEGGLQAELDLGLRMKCLCALASLCHRLAAQRPCVDFVFLQLLASCRGASGHPGSARLLLSSSAGSQCAAQGGPSSARSAPMSDLWSGSVAQRTESRGLSVREG